MDPYRPASVAATRCQYLGGLWPLSQRPSFTDPLHRDAPGQTPFTETPLDRPPSQRSPWTDSLHRDPPGQTPFTETPLDRHAPPRRNMGPWTETPIEGRWHQAARQEDTSYRELPPHEQNDWHTLLKILPCPKFRGEGNTECILKRKIVENLLRVLLHCPFTMNRSRI